MSISRSYKCYQNTEVTLFKRPKQIRKVSVFQNVHLEVVISAVYPRDLVGNGMLN